jgi:hypothetical protein
MACINPNIIIIIIIINIIIFFRLRKISKNISIKEPFTDSFEDGQLLAIRNQINSIYNVNNLDSIRDLSAISKSLLTGYNYHDIEPKNPGDLTIPADKTLIRNLIVNKNLYLAGNTTISGDIKSNKNNIKLVVDGLVSFFPIGCIILWYSQMSNIPPGWAACDGTTPTPDLRNRFIMAAGQVGWTNPTTGVKATNDNSDNSQFGPYGPYGPKDKGGEEAVIAVSSNFPKHHHTVNMWNNLSAGIPESSGYTLVRHNGFDRDVADRKVAADFTPPFYTGSWDTASHSNIPSYHALIYIMRIK